MTMIQPHESIWAYRAVATNTKDAGQTLQFDIIPGLGNHMRILSITIGPDDYGADETIAVTHFDDDDNLAGGRLMRSAAIDNERLRGPVLMVEDGATATAESLVGAPTIPYVVAGKDKLDILTSALADNETLTIAIRAIVLHKPTVTLITSTEATLVADIDELLT